LLEPASWLDDVHVAFGKVTKGFDVLDKMAENAVYWGKTTAEITISDCGMID